jgi:hypothetical protein
MVMVMVTIWTRGRGVSCSAKAAFRCSVVQQSNVMFAAASQGASQHNSSAWALAGTTLGRWCTGQQLPEWSGLGLLEDRHAEVILQAMEEGQHADQHRMLCSLLRAAANVDPVLSRLSTAVIQLALSK